MITIKKLEDDKTQLDQLKAEIKENATKSIEKSENDHDVIINLVNDMQGQSDRQMELVSMINDLRQEISQLKELKH